MNESMDSLAAQAALDAAESAAGAGRLSPGAFANIRRWLTETGYAAYRPTLAAMITAGRFEELEGLFWEVIPFGTGGRRGTMTEIGSATMNDRTVAESANGIAVYLQKVKARPGGRAVIAHDTRLRSREFAELTACVLAAHGLQVFLFEAHRSTPELSFAVRHLKCDVGVMISASHNPPSDNGVKAYWSNGAQVLPPHDKGIIDCVYESNEIPRADLATAMAEGRIELIGDDVDAAYVRAVLGQSLSSARDVTCVFTPLHGAGETSVYRVLEEAGFEGVALFEPQRAQLPQRSRPPAQPGAQRRLRPPRGTSGRVGGRSGAGQRPRRRPPGGGRARRHGTVPATFRQRAGGAAGRLYLAQAQEQRHTGTGSLRGHHAGNHAAGGGHCPIVQGAGH